MMRDSLSRSLKTSRPGLHGRSICRPFLAYPLILSKTVLSSRKSPVLIICRKEDSKRVMLFAVDVLERATYQASTKEGD